MPVDDSGIKAQNKFVKYFTGGTEHNRRTLTNNDIYKIHDVEVAVPMISQPMCEYCERIAIWSHGTGILGEFIPTGHCEYCGTITKKPLTYGEYLANGYDIPSWASGKEKEDMIKARKMLNLAFNIDGKDGRE